MSRFNTDFVVPAEPVDWDGWTVTEKARWLVNHARPKPTWQEAHRILSRRAAAKRAIRALREEREKRRVAAVVGE